jgi:hypothetical protein
MMWLSICDKLYYKDNAAVIASKSYAVCLLVCTCQLIAAKHALVHNVPSYVVQYVITTDASAAHSAVQMQDRVTGMLKEGTNEH